MYAHKKYLIFKVLNSFVTFFVLYTVFNEKTKKIKNADNMFLLFEIHAYEKNFISQILNSFITFFVHGTVFHEKNLNKKMLIIDVFVV